MATHKPVLVDELFGELKKSDKSDKWHVIHTKPQCEKKLADYLKRNGTVYYLPLMDSIRHYKYRKVTFTKPMFPGYLFARFDAKVKEAVLLSSYVVAFLKVPSEEELLSDLACIYAGRVRKAEYHQSIWLEQGWQVEVVSGSMRGITGIVQSQVKLSEVILQVDILRQAVSIKVKPEDVRIISEYHSRKR